MDTQSVLEQLEGVVEQLAALEHERWSHWQKYMHSKCVNQPDGSLLIPRDLVARWEKQVRKPYTELSEAEKESDREQVRRYFPVVAKAVCRNTDTADD